MSPVRMDDPNHAARTGGSVKRLAELVVSPEQLAASIEAITQRVVAECSADEADAKHVVGIVCANLTAAVKRSNRGKYVTVVSTGFWTTDVRRKLLLEILPLNTRSEDGSIQRMIEEATGCWSDVLAGVDHDSAFAGHLVLDLKPKFA